MVKFLFLKREDEAWTYKTVLEIFEILFRFQAWISAFHIYKRERFFLEKNQ